jgi:hypothetical protein
MAITIERTVNYDLVRRIIVHPRMYSWLVADGAPSKFVILRGEFPWYVLIRDGDELLGIFILVPLNGVCWEVHACLLPNAWGVRTREACRQGIDWLAKNSPCVKVIANICSENRLALGLARRLGAKIIGVNETSILRGGQLKDQVIVGLNLVKTPSNIVPSRVESNQTSDVAGS